MAENDEYYPRSIIGDNSNVPDARKIELKVLWEEQFSMLNYEDINSWNLVAEYVRKSSDVELKRVYDALKRPRLLRDKELNQELLIIKTDAAIAAGAKPNATAAEKAAGAIAQLRKDRAAVREELRVSGASSFSGCETTEVLMGEDVDKD